MSLSETSSKIKSLFENVCQAQDADNNAGLHEFSGDVIYRAYKAQASNIVRADGFTSYEEFLQEVKNRTSERWVHFNTGFDYFC